MKLLKAFIFKFFFSAVILIPAIVYGQQVYYNSPDNELIYVHLDKSTYVAGEVINYKAYLANGLNPGSSLCSKILYFTLSGGNETLNWRINITGKSMAGKYLLPDNLKEGIYQLTAYTNWMLNGDPSTFFKQQIIITSLSKENGNSIRTVSRRYKPVINQQNETVLHAVTSKRSYRANEPVVLEISIKDNEKMADLSVAVNPENPFDRLMEHSDITSAIPVLKGTVKRQSLQNCTYPLEDKCYILSGRIVALQRISEPCNVWLSVVDSVAPAILYSLTDSAGNFRFYLSRQFDNKELILQLADPQQSKDCHMELFSKVVAVDTVTSPTIMDSIQASYLRTTEDIRLIEAVYEENSPVVKLNSSSQRLNYFGKPDKIIFPKDFSDMRNFREIANNIAPDIRFLMRNGKFRLMVLSPASIWKDCNLVLLNGVPFTDLAYISTLGTKDIQRIEIIKSNVIVGNITLPGLVSIFTYNNEIPENYLKSYSIRFMNTVTDASSVAEDQIGKPQSGNHFPDFRNCVYWNPFVMLLRNKPTVITFPALLLKGHFTIRIEGFTDDGIPVSTSATYEVTE